ncbi:MAG: cation transporter [Methanomicrobium sp.]|nr:cation transporter [Methanomicrobium sp.]MBR6498036.1 cation transporter [Methanomicrobium sp.]
MHADLKKKTARLSIISNTSLFILKIAVGLCIGSVSIISEAIHSGMDLLAAIIAFFSVKMSAEPADTQHEFGHGKFEDVSGLIEASLIFAAAVMIIWEAASKLIAGDTELIPDTMLYSGLAVMGISAVVNWYVSARLMKVAKLTESIALESDAMHLKTDIYTSIGVAFVIIHAAYDLAKRSSLDLIDYSLPDEDKEKIRAIICRHQTEYRGFHGLRTRRGGPNIFIEFHMVVAGEETVRESHRIGDEIEADIRKEYPRAFITIHVEPCRDIADCKRCGEFCTNKNNNK